jgi:hypothetical protein
VTRPIDLNDERHPMYRAIGPVGCTLPSYMARESGSHMARKAGREHIRASIGIAMLVSSKVVWGPAKGFRWFVYEEEGRRYAVQHAVATDRWYSLVGEGERGWAVVEGSEGTREEAIRVARLTVELHVTETVTVPWTPQSPGAAEAARILSRFPPEVDVEAAYLATRHGIPLQEAEAVLTAGGWRRRPDGMWRRR